MRQHIILAAFPALVVRVRGPWDRVPNIRFSHLIEKPQTLNTSGLRDERSRKLAYCIQLCCIGKRYHEFLDSGCLIGGDTLADGLY